MTQREKLIELIEERRAYQWQNAKGVINSAPIIICLEDIVDYLIANGVVALPCKVGDTLWSASPFTDGKVREGYISAFFC